jgi:hypothetical protein
MRRLSALVTLVVLPIGSLAGDTAPSVKETINRGLAFLARPTVLEDFKSRLFAW